LDAQGRPAGIVLRSRPSERLMKIDTRPLRDRHQTASAMRRIIRQYAGDLLKGDRVENRDGRAVALGRLSLAEMFNLVKDIPYKTDIEPSEIIGRPKILLEGADGGLDCKKKAILMAAWCEVNGKPWELFGSSIRKDKDIHHVFPGVMLDGKTWINIDATYPENRIGERKRVTAAEVL